MKKIKLLSYLVILLSGFLFLQCTSDEPIYVAGDAGADGTQPLSIITWVTHIISLTK